MSDTWVPEDSVTGAAVPAAADSWSEEKPQTWREWLTHDATGLPLTSPAHHARHRALPPATSRCGIAPARCPTS